MQNSTYRKCLLSLSMLAAVIFVFQGIVVPTFPNPQEPKLSSTLKVEPSTSAAIKTLQQSPQLKIVKIAPFFLVLCNEHRIKAPATLLSDLQLESYSFTSAVISSSSARAPPA